MSYGSDVNRQVAGWTAGLADEDLSFIKRFILASGSLKELAGVYGISYPTVRLRLDRLIEKVKLLDRLDITSEFEPGSANAACRRKDRPAVVEAASRCSRGRDDEGA